MTYSGSREVWQRKRTIVFNAFRWRCLYCGVRLNPLSARHIGHKANDATLDHLTPKAQGGGHGVRNLVAACHQCNSRRGKSSVLAYALMVTSRNPVLMGAFLGRWAQALVSLRSKYAQPTRG